MANIDKYTAGLNKALIGKKNYFFLVNDNNNELKQHYDNSYKNNFNQDLFRKSQKSKEDYFESKGIAYGFFVIPDKSVVLREYLPFDTEEPVRHVDGLSDCVCDMLSCFDESDYIRNDTNPIAQCFLNVVPHILIALHDDKSILEYEELLSAKVYSRVENHLGNLFADGTWSDKYPGALWDKYAFSDVEFLKPVDDVVEINSSDMPYFRCISENCRYFINSNSISDKKAVISCDESISNLMPAFIGYYREIIFSYDGGCFNEKFLNWFKADDVLEVRMENSLDNLPCPIINQPHENDYQVIVKIEESNIDGDILTVKLDVVNPMCKGIVSICDIFINNKLIHSQTLPKGKLKFKRSLTYRYHGHSKVYICIRNIAGSGNKFEFIHAEDIFIPVTDIKKYLKAVNGKFIGKDHSVFKSINSTDRIAMRYGSDGDSNFDFNHFKDTYGYKKNYLNGKNIGYDVFSIVDKCVVSKDSLDFLNTEPRRFVNKVDTVHHIDGLLRQDGYTIYDTKLSDKALFKIICYVLSTISDKPFMHYERLLSGYLSYDDYCLFKKSLKSNYGCDKEYIIEDKSIKKHSRINISTFFKRMDSEIPEEFSSFNDRKAHLYRNENSITDKKLLLFHDFLFAKFFPLFSTYFREVLVYNSLGLFLKEVVDWYNPDHVIELYSESIMDSAEYLIDSDCTVHLPCTVSLDECMVEDSQLNISLSAVDFFGRNVDTVSDIKINGELINTVPFAGGVCKFSCPVSNMGYFFVDISVHESKVTKGYAFEKILFEPIVNFKEYFDSINKTMLGKENQLFLVNDINDGIKYHFDGSYVHDFNDFKVKQDFKKDYMLFKDISYKFFIIPDKSVLFREYLPFKTNICRRICDEFKYMDDLGIILDKSDYLEFETQVSPASSLKIVPYILSKSSSCSYDDLKNEIEGKTHLITKKVKCNLLKDKNWSYGIIDFHKRNVCVDLDFVELNDSYEEVSQNEMPEEFRKENAGDSKYYINYNSISNKKALIFCDSNANYMVMAFVSYYREVFFYLDGWKFNIDLINWFLPDEIIELRTERFLVNSVIEFIYKGKLCDDVPKIRD